jgi:hypothetical protein
MLHTDKNAHYIRAHARAHTKYPVHLRKTRYILCMAHGGGGGGGGVVPFFLDLGTRRGEWSASCRGHLSLAGKEPPLLMVQEAGWSPEPAGRRG